MKKMKSLLLGILISNLAFTQTASDSSLLGKWKTEEGTIITISKSNGTIIGLNSQGEKTLYNIQFANGSGKGVVTNNVTGRTGICEIYLEDKKLKITAHKGPLSKSFYWFRYN